MNEMGYPRNDVTINMSNICQQYDWKKMRTEKWDERRDEKKNHKDGETKKNKS